MGVNPQRSLLVRTAAHQQQKGMLIESGIPFLYNFFSAETNRTHHRANICPNGNLC